jgi:hypothetical protein
VSAVSVHTVELSPLKFKATSLKELAAMTSTVAPEAPGVPPGVPEINIALATWRGVRVTVIVAVVEVATDAPARGTAPAPPPAVVVASCHFVRSTAAWLPTRVSLPVTVSTPVLKLRVTLFTVGGVVSAVSEIAIPVAAVKELDERSLNAPLARLRTAATPSPPGVPDIAIAAARLVSGSTNVTVGWVVEMVADTPDN